MAFNVFISYSTHDLSLAKQVSRLLRLPGCSKPFLAEDSVQPGQQLDPKIIAAIKQCDLFILLWSNHAKASDWVEQEVGIARGCDRPIIPIALHESAVPAGFLRGTKYMRLYEDPKRNLEWLQKHVFASATKKEQQQGAVWLGVGAAIIWLLSQKE